MTRQERRKSSSAKSSARRRALPRSEAVNERERRFVDAYTGPAAGNATAAAITAGYSRKTARQTGSRLLTKAHIRAAIEAATATSANAAILTRQQRQEFWTRVANDPEQEMKHRLKASELLGKSQGDFLERREHEHHHSGAVHLRITVVKGKAA